MKQNARTRSPRPVRFKIEASRCNVRIGDSVTPDTVVGTDSETGETLMARCHGKVVAVHFSGGEHTLTLHIQPTHH